MPCGIFQSVTAQSRVRNESVHQPPLVEISTDTLIVAQRVMNWSRITARDLSGRAGFSMPAKDCRDQRCHRR